MIPDRYTPSLYLKQPFITRLALLNAVNTTQKGLTILISSIFAYGRCVVTLCNHYQCVPHIKIPQVRTLNIQYSITVCKTELQTSADRRAASLKTLGGPDHCLRYTDFFFLFTYATMLCKLS